MSENNNKNENGEEPRIKPPHIGPRPRDNEQNPQPAENPEPEE